MSATKTVFFMVFLMVMSMSVLTGCQKKVTKVPEAAMVKPKAPEIAAPNPTPNASDTESFKEANLEGELLRQAQEALQNIYFDFNKAIILPQSETRLKIIGNFMTEHAAMRILVAGNCDERGSNEYNIGLGEKRASAAKKFLMVYGIPDDRLEITSYGKERLAIQGCTDEPCHAKNRRDEFTVLQNKGQPLSKIE
jgi:peptidoglycan-associated lipoprotein